MQSSYYAVLSMPVVIGVIFGKILVGTDSYFFSHHMDFSSNQNPCAAVSIAKK
jgi:hypothetical protein